MHVFNKNKHFFFLSGQLLTFGRQGLGSEGKSLFLAILNWKVPKTHKILVSNMYRTSTYLTRLGISLCYGIGLMYIQNCWFTNKIMMGKKISASFLYCRSNIHSTWFDGAPSKLLRIGTISLEGIWIKIPTRDDRYSHGISCIWVKGQGCSMSGNQLSRDVALLKFSLQLAVRLWFIRNFWVMMEIQPLEGIK